MCPWDGFYHRKSLWIFCAWLLKLYKINIFMMSALITQYFLEFSKRAAPTPILQALFRCCKSYAGKAVFAISWQRFVISWQIQSFICIKLDRSHFVFIQFHLEQSFDTTRFSIISMLMILSSIALLIYIHLMKLSPPFRPVFRT